MLSKLNKEPVYNDKLVILEDNGTADIATIYDQDDAKIYAESSTHDYAVPKGDCKVHVGSRGRIYVIGADSEYITDTKRLAALEKSIVLRQVTHFEREKIENVKKVDIKQIMLWCLIGVLVLGVIFK